MATYLDINMTLVLNQQISIVGDNILVIKLSISNFNCDARVPPLVDWESRFIKTCVACIPTKYVKFVRKNEMKK